MYICVLSGVAICDNICLKNNNNNNNNNNKHDENTNCNTIKTSNHL